MNESYIDRLPQAIIGPEGRRSDMRFRTIEECMTPTARISRATWQADREWKQKNPEGRLKAIWHPKGERIYLVRLSGPAILKHKGEEVDYPAALLQPTTWTVHTDPGPTVTVKLEWVE
ncbi:MAG: hypothetical protein WC145_11770 [Aliarcobacter sp.]|jgi:hypothetical protein